MKFIECAVCFCCSGVWCHACSHQDESMTSFWCLASHIFHRHEWGEELMCLLPPDKSLTLHLSNFSKPPCLRNNDSMETSHHKTTLTRTQVCRVMCRHTSSSDADVCRSRSEKINHNYLRWLEQTRATVSFIMTCGTSPTVSFLNWFKTLHSSVN